MRVLDVGWVLRERDSVRSLVTPYKAVCEELWSISSDAPSRLGYLESPGKQYVASWRAWIAAHAVDQRPAKITTSSTEQTVDEQQGPALTCQHLWNAHDAAAR